MTDTRRRHAESGFCTKTFVSNGRRHWCIRESKHEGRCDTYRKGCSCSDCRRKRQMLNPREETP